MFLNKALNKIAKTGVLALLLAIGVAVIAPSAEARKLRQSTLNNQLADIQQRLYERQQNPNTAIPKELLAQVRAVLFIDQFKAGFIFGVKGGRGVAFLHDGQGGFSAPAFYRIGGGGVGLQLGGEQRYSTILIMQPEATRILTGDSGEYGVEANAVGGPFAGLADYSNFSQQPMLVYSNAVGLFAGASFEGSVISPSQKANEVMYAQRPITALDILEGRVPAPRAARGLIELLGQYALEGQEALREQEAAAAQGIVAPEGSEGKPAQNPIPVLRPEDTLPGVVNE